MIRNHSKFYNVLKRFLVMVVIMFLLILGWSGYVLWKINTVDPADASQSVDVGIILGSSMWGDAPSPSLKERLDHGLKQYNKGKFKWFIVTGGLDQPGFNYTEAEGMRQYLLEHGVPDNVILMENDATSTLENLQFSQLIMKQRGFTSAVLVTHTYHGMRSLQIAEYLDYAHPLLSTTESKVLSMSYHKSREILAYSKWKLDEWMLRLKLNRSKLLITPSKVEYIE
jgi:vancomycin permeability regulator SanA